MDPHVALRRVRLRGDGQVGQDEQLLVRMNDDHDVINALKLTLAHAPAYQVVPGFEPCGALAISCLAVANELEAQIIVRGTQWSIYGLAQAGELRALGCSLVATEVLDGDELLPLSDRHVDVLVCAYPPDLAEYVALSRTERAKLRAGLLDRFATVLRAFDPRRSA